MLGLVVDRDIFLATPLDRHAAALHELIEADRDRLQRWVDVSGLRTVDDHRAAMGVARRAMAAGRQYPFVVEVGGDVAGVLRLAMAPGRAHVGEVGYLLGQRFEGQGIAGRAVATVIDAAIARAGMHRFEIRCSCENVRSGALARRLGFRVEGLLRGSVRNAGGYCDEVLYAILADDWIAGRPTKASP